ncbi:beta clamp domain-containing protein, partial [Actinophytocola sediminis]
MTETTATVTAHHLKSLLDDAARTSESDDTLPFITGVLLYTAPNAGATVLVASATDRFTLGQVHTDATGHLGETFVPLADVKRARQALTLVDPDSPAGLSIVDDKLRITTPTLSLALATGDVAAEVWGKFGKLFDTTNSTSETRIAVSAELLAKFLPIAKARGVGRSNIVVETYGEKRPIHIHIGTRYRAMVMPVYLSDRHAPVPLFLSPTEQAAADQAAQEQADAERKAKRSAAAKKAAATRAANTTTPGKSRRTTRKVA